MDPGRRRRTQGALISAKAKKIRDITEYKPVWRWLKQPLMLPQFQTFEVRRRPATTGWPAGR